MCLSFQWRSSHSIDLHYLNDRTFALICKHNNNSIRNRVTAESVPSIVIIPMMRTHELDT
jgi:hypothetical protein